MAYKTNAAIVITDSLSRVAYINDGFTRMFGWTLEEIRGQKMLELLARQASVEIFNNLRGELREGRSVKLVEVVTGKAGHRYWIKMLSNPVMDEDGHWQYTVSMLLDITSTKMHEVLNNRVLEAMARDLPLMDVLR